MRLIKILFSLCLVSSVSFAQINVKGRIDHIVPDGTDTLGNIYLTVSGGTSPYTYTWSPGGANTKDLTNATANSYTVKVRGSGTDSVYYKYKLGYKTKWTNFISCFLRNDTIFGQTAAPNYPYWGWNSTVSKNTLKASTDGWVQWVVTSTAYNVMVGFLDSVTIGGTGLYSDRDHGIYQNGANIYRSGSASVLTTCSAGDVLRIERSGTTLSFLKNGTQLASYTVSTAKDWKLKADIQSSYLHANIGASFIDTASISFPNYVEDIPNISHCTPGSSNGSIKLSPRISGTTHTYTWSTSATTSSVTSLSTGNYSVDIKDSDLNLSKYNYNVGYKTYWTNFFGTKFRNDSLLFQSPTSASGWNTAISKNTLKAGTDGWVEIVSKSLSDIYMVGFLDSVSVVPGVYTDMDYGVYLQNNKIYRIYGGVYTILSSFKVGDIIRFERIGTTFYIKINGNTINSVSCSSLALKLKSVLNTGNVWNIGASFKDTSDLYFPNYVQDKALIKHCTPGLSDGSIKLSPKVSGSARSYTWTPGGATTSSITSLSFGTYTATIMDVDSNISKPKFNVGYKTYWTNFYGTKTRNDSLLFQSPTSPSGWNTAVSKNTLKAGVDGWIEYVVNSVTGYNKFGFVDSVAAVTGFYQDIDYGFSFNVNQIWRYTSAGLTFLGGYDIGDIFRIERIGTTLYFKQNGATIYSMSCSSGKDWKIKSVLNNETMSNIGASFYDSTSVSFPNFVQANVSIVNTDWSANNGRISLVPKYSGTYSYQWLPDEEISSEVTNKDISTQTVTIIDPNLNQSKFRYNIGYKLFWDQLYNASVSEDTLKNTGSAWAASVSSNTLAANTDGWLEYVIPSSAYSQVIGFLDTSITISSVNDIDYSLYLEGSTRRIFRYLSGSSTFLWHYDAGDIIRIERVGSNVVFKINNYTLSSVSVPTVTLNKTWKVKAMMYGSGSRVIGPSIPIPIMANLEYAKLLKQLDGSYYSTGGNKLFFTLDGEYSNMTLSTSNFAVYDYKRVAQAIFLSNTGFNNGDNRYQLNIASFPAGFYVLEVSNQKKEKLYLRFKK